MKSGRTRRRMVVKVGSSSIADAQRGLCVQKMEQLVAQVANIQRQGDWQVLLVSSGAVAAGLSKLGWRRANITIPEKQAAAAVGQGLLMDTYERLFRDEQILIGQLLLTRADVEDRKRFVHVRNTVLTLVKNGIVPVVNENDTVAVEEIRFGDNDTLASLVALVAEADRLVLLTDIDGLYTGNPAAGGDVRRISDIWEITDDVERMAGDSNSSVGTGGMRTKIAAAKIAVQSGADVVIAASEEPDVLLKIARGERVGTTFHATPSRVGLRKSWLMHGSRLDGRIIVDAGAASALTRQSKSLLMPGVTGVEGDFQEGAVIGLVTQEGLMIGRGVVNFSSRDLAMLLMQRQAGERLYNLQEVVHRNDMVVCKGGALG
ncbi:glutamate 5-kinase [Alicyclobacillus fodiniaquatilis]|uniref:Glutamate 5-kinase n=1 Tax=Alicyclobacillus fodiniaquatilis TaxID=1661150 RepID=A0ABW4JNR4_9BACL